MARRLPEGDEEVPEEPFPDPDRPGRPVPLPEGVPPEVENILEARLRWLEMIDYWHKAAGQANAKQFSNADFFFEESQKAAVRYFENFYALTTVPQASTADKLGGLVMQCFDKKDELSTLWEKVRRRREAITLEDLQRSDWGGFSAAVRPLFKIGRIINVPGNTPEESRIRQQSLDYFALILATIFIPLARAEMNRQRRNFNAAIEDYERLLKPYRKAETAAPLVWLMCDFIERPFVLLALGETLMEKAEVQFKAASQGKADEARATYQRIPELFKDHGAYATRVTSAQKKLTDDADQLPQLPPDRKDVAIQVLGKDITVPGIESKTKELPGLSQTKAPAESWLLLNDTVAGEVNAETNPRIYALLLNAQARLLQIENGFNYLGYKDNYIPPWRFQFLLERARYFSEHAKNAQRDYLNFLSNAEREEFQEQSAAQAVEMEKANVRVESARVNQVGFEVVAAQQSKELAELTRANSVGRLQDYKAFDKYADEQDRKSRSGGFFSFAGGAISGAISGGKLGGLGAIAGALSGIGSSLQQDAQLGVSDRQRGLEKGNLGRAVAEAAKAAEIASAQFEVAKLGLVVASLQRQAALLRHEFAIQNLEYLRNRTLNAEQWFRLANAIRSIADTYLRYAIELAFLSEQAYEFEADKPINVIRFDYDQSELGAFLAADFLLSDLDTIEQDFVVNQRQRQQLARYVLSLAREFPAALEELQDTGRVNFILRLEQIEKRFPGLYNARIGMVDVLPVALMDSTRFSLDLTHTGSGQLRIKGQPDVRVGEQSKSVLNVNDLPLADYDWTKTPKELWPVKILINEPETTVFSGLSRQDAASAFPVASSGQRNAFEGRGVAGGWQIDMSARENQVVPGSLADLLITFTLSGYHDSGLRDAIDSAKPQTTALTSFISAQQTFPDAFYDFSRTGRMVWKVPRELLTLDGDLGRLRNVGMSLRPGAPDMNFSRLMTRLRVRFRINESGGVASGVTVFTAIPETSVTQTAPLTVAVRARLDAATELAWDFGDGTPILRTVRSGTTPIAPAEGTHVYAKPGRYVLKLRCIQNDSLSDLRIAVTVSRTQKLGEPLIVRPRFGFDTNAKTLTMTTGGAVQQTGRMLWRIGELTAEGNSATFTLKPGHYGLDFTAVRKLNFRAYSVQRYIKDLAPLPLKGLSGTTNRTFDDSGKETNGTGTPPLPARNELAKRLFGTGELSPEDDWTFELVPEELLGLRAGTAIGAEQLDLSEIQDVVLSMEYDVTPGGP